MDTLWMFGQKDGFGWTARQMDGVSCHPEFAGMFRSFHEQTPLGMEVEGSPEGLSGGFRTGKKTCTLWAERPGALALAHL